MSPPVLLLLRCPPQAAVVLWLCPCDWLCVQQDEPHQDRATYHSGSNGWPGNRDAARTAHCVICQPGRVGEPEDERRWAELRFRARPLAHYLPSHHCSCCETSWSQEPHWNGFYNRGNKGTAEGWGEACNTVVVVFLMRIRLQITVFIKYNECQWIYLVSSDARTYRQLSASKSQHVYSQPTSCLIQNFHFTLSLNLLPAAVTVVITAVVEPADDPRGLQNASCTENISFIPRLHQNKCTYDIWPSQSPSYIKKALSIIVCIVKLSQLCSLLCVRQYTTQADTAQGGMVHSVELTGTYLWFNVIYFHTELGRGRCIGRSIWFG